MHPVNVICFVNHAVVVVERFLCFDSILHRSHKTWLVFSKDNFCGVALRKLIVFIFRHAENCGQSRRRIKRFDSRPVDAVDGNVARNVLFYCCENLWCYFHDDQQYIILKVYHQFFNKTIMENIVIRKSRKIDYEIYDENLLAKTKKTLY